MKRLREDLHRYRFLLPCALAAVMLLRWAVLRGRPERIMPLRVGPMAQWIGVHDGKAITFGVADNGSDLVAFSNSIEGRSEQLLVRHPSGNSEIGAFIADGYLYVINVWYRDPGPRLSLQSAPSALGPGQPLPPWIQPVRPSRKPAADRNVLGLLAFGNRGPIGFRARTTLHRMPLGGGRLQLFHLDPGRPDPVFLHVAVVGGKIYWSRRTPRRAGDRSHPPPLSGGAGSVARFDLMATPAVGGPAITLDTGLYQSARIFSTTEGVCWRVVRPDRAGSSDVVFVSGTAGKPSIRRNIPFNVVGSPAACNGRIYWIDDPNGFGYFGGPLDSVPARTLMSARPDGSDIRVVLHLSADARNGSHLSRIFAADNRLYGAVTEARPTKGGEDSYRHFLCAINPESDSVITKLTPLPRRLAERGVLDGGYYYFIVNEPVDSFFDMDRDGERPPDRYYLYRWKLPQDGAA